MSHDMPSIDLSGIEELRTIKKDQDVIKERLEKMVSMKGNVSEAVYEKVFSEYSDKLDQVTEQAEPLKNRLRAQYAILKDLLARLEAEINNINMEKEEIEFRNTLGEFDEGAYQDQLKDWEERFTHKTVELEEAQSMKAAFLEVFDSEEDLEIPADLNTMPINTAMGTRTPTPPLSPEIEEDLEPVDDSMPDTDLDISMASEPEPLPEDETDLSLETQIIEADDQETLANGEVELMGDLPPDLGIKDDMDTNAVDDIDDDLVDDLDGDFADDLDDDIVDDLDDTGDLDLDDVPMAGNLDEETASGDHVAMPPMPNDSDATMMMETLPQAGPEGGEPETMIIANPKVVSMNNATEGQVIVLGMGTTSIGRSPESDIHITEDRISRKHSQITFGPGGYALYDLNSENGTYVNGQRIREHYLQDGDIIQVGTFKYLYRDH